MVDYVNKVYLKEVGTFGNIKFTGSVADLILELQKHKRADGKFRFEIKKKEKPLMSMETHITLLLMIGCQVVSKK
jgi:hypothetical protein